jgi:hypothetical protein
MLIEEDALKEILSMDITEESVDTREYYQTLTKEELIELVAKTKVA